MIKLSITFAVTFVFSVGKRLCQVTWNQTMDVIWCDVMSCHPMSCQVCHDMISISCHVTSLYVILYYFWLRLITSSHLLSVRDVVLNVSFFFAGFGTSAEMYYDTTLQEAFFDAALEKYDVLILPTIPKKAPVFPKEKSPPLQGPIVIISSH